MATSKTTPQKQHLKNNNWLVTNQFWVEGPGSGKSLTILIAARKLWNLLNQPTIIIVVDREQLQDQMVKQFVQTNTQNCRIAEGKDDLLSLLRDGDGYRGIILTIMHKFDWRDAVEIKRADVVML